jgi:transcriptional regulator with XRE-family HTH domain
MTSQQIKDLRDALHLTQQKLADTIAATQVTVARWESGTSRPTGAYLKALDDLARTATKKQKTKSLKQLDSIKKTGWRRNTRARSNTTKTRSAKSGR